MQRTLSPKTKDELIRISTAYAWYHHPEYVDFKKQLLILLDDPDSLSWINKCKIFQLMPNYYRRKLLKYYPQLFPDIDLFNLMICAFIPEDQTAELALAHVPHLRTQAQYQKLLTVIPEHELESFKFQAERILEPILDAETLDLSITLEVPHKNASRTDKETSLLNPITPNKTLLTVSALLYFYTQTYNYSLPVLWALYSLYNYMNNGLHATATQFERFLPFKSIFAAPPKIITNQTDNNDNRKEATRYVNQ